MSPTTSSNASSRDWRFVKVKERLSILLILYEENPLVTGGFLIKKTSDAELWFFFLWYQPNKLLDTELNYRNKNEPCMVILSTELRLSIVFHQL